MAEVVDDSKQVPKVRKRFRSSAIGKVLIVLGIVLGSLLLLLGIGVVVLQQSSVQTYLVHIVTNRLSEYVGADVHVGHVEYKPLCRLTLDSVYIGDQQQDTLAYIERAHVVFHPLLLREQRLDLNLVSLERPYVNIQSVEGDSVLNYEFLIEKFMTDTVSFALRVNVDQLLLSDMRVRYEDLLVDQLQLDLTMPMLSQDSMDVKIESLSLCAHLDRLDARLEADLHGCLDSVFADKMQLVYRGERLFVGDIAVYHPLQLDSLYIQADCEDLYCHHALLQDMLSQLLSRPVHLPRPVAALGTIHYKGEVVGRLEDMNLQGAFSTSLGTLTVNGHSRTDTTLRNMSFCGKVSTRRFHVGRLLHEKDLGVVALSAHVDGKLDSTEAFSCVADAHINRLEYKGYTYRDIHFDGGFEEDMVSGELRVDDENVRLRVDGLVDLSEEDTRFYFSLRLEDCKPAAMHLIDRYPDMVISSQVYISLFTSGSAAATILDHLRGAVMIDSLDVRNGERQAMMKELRLLIDNEDRHGKPYHQLRLQSDYLTASIHGPFDYTTLPATLTNMFSKYMPSMIGSKTVSKHLPNDVDFYAYFRDIEQITQLLELGVDVPHYPTIKGYVHESTNQLGLQAYIPTIQTSSAWLEDVTVSLDNLHNRLGLSVYVLNHLPKDNPTAAKIGDVRAYMDVTAQNNIVGLTVRLDNTDSVRNAGTIRVSSEFMRYADKPLVNVHIHPTEIVLNDSTWSIGDAHIVYTAADKTLGVEHLSLSTSHQSILAHGMASASESDSIHVELKNINVNYLLGYTEASKAISVEGPLTGMATIYGLFSEPMFEARCYIPNAGLNGVPLGNAFAEARLDAEEKKMIIVGDVIDSTHVVAHVDGEVIPRDKRWALDIACDSADLKIVNFWTQGILSDLQGAGYGNLHIDGHDHDTYITARLYGKDAQLTVPQIGATFMFSDSVFMDSTSIRFPHITLHDVEGHTGTFDGVLSHTLFEDFRYDMTAVSDNLLVMNLPYDPQAIFYGKVYGSGSVHIQGDEQECKISVNARTDSKSKFYLSVATASTASSTSFINFVQADTTSHHLLRLLNQPKEQKPVVKKRATRVLLSLLVEVTPTAEILLRMGGDDGLRGRGEGNIRLDYDDLTEDIQMLGTFTLQSGLFSFSLGNIVRRNFDIAEGSRVIWNGDPTSPTVDVTGRYHLTASLRDLYGSDVSQISTNRTSVPVNCVLHMTDMLFNPIINFAVELPQSDEAVQSQVKSIINTDEMLMRQIIYLLVFNRFYTPEYLQNTKNVGVNETYSLLSSTITGQINSWISKLTDNFSMGFNIRTDGEGETASQEYEANFQIHPINQLLINGNFGYRYNDLSNRPFFGDLDIEYLLTENGKLRAKAYTHTVDKYSLKQANTVQGVGFVFKHDFNWPTHHRKDSIANDTIYQNTITSKTH